MTLDEALEFIRENSKPGDWAAFSDEIRHAVTGECPVCWVGSQKGANPTGLKESHLLVAPFLGMSRKEAEEIADAADWANGRHRTRLKTACHLGG